MAPMMTGKEIRAAIQKALEDAGNTDHETLSMASIYALTDREKEVLALVTEGLTNKAIAEALSMTVRTVEVHCLKVYQMILADCGDRERYNPRVYAVRTWLRFLDSQKERNGNLRPTSITRVYQPISGSG